MKSILVLVPGIFNKASIFYKEFMKMATSRGYICYPIDFPLQNTHFNESPNPALGHLSLKHNYNFLLAQIEKITVLYPRSKVFLIGHSRGALLAQMAMESIMFSGAVLLNPALPNGISSLNIGVIKTFAEQILAGRFWQKPIKRSFKATKWGVLPTGMDKGEAQKDYSELVYESGRVVFELGFKKPLVNNTHLNDGRILIMSGTQDRLINPEAVKKLAEKYNTNAKFFNTAHYPFWGDEGKKVEEYIFSWLKTVKKI